MTRPMYPALLFLCCCCPNAASADLREEMLGEWVRSSHESSAEEAPQDTYLNELKVEREHLEYNAPNGEQREIRYELFRDGDEWVIDLYAQYGRSKGMIYPSRIALVNNELSLMLPLNSCAGRRRPKKLEAANNPDWVVFRFRRSGEEKESEAL